jgi:hypothetical protein
VYDRAKSLLSHRLPFGKAPIDMGPSDPWVPVDEQMILRMLIKHPETGFRIPDELLWLDETIHWLTGIQRQQQVENNFIYVTVRHGVVSSVDDDVWHVDGFSMRVPHVPEQNYIWTDSNPTEILNQEISLPDDFDPMKQNVHQYFQDVAREENTFTLRAGRIYGIDPYVIHRRPKLPAGTRRTFFRISFVPVEIEDDTNTPNPLLETRSYGRIGTEIRKSLSRYMK